MNAGNAMTDVNRVFHAVTETAGADALSQDDKL